MALPAILGLVATIADPIVDALFETEAEKASAKVKIMEVMQRMDHAQIQVNMQEAQHRSIFVAGWRPFIGWTCGSALAYTYIGHPFAIYLATLMGYGEVIKDLPSLSLIELMPVCLGMLGLGYLRTREKEKGTDQSSIPLGG